MEENQEAALQDLEAVQIAWREVEAKWNALQAQLKQGTEYSKQAPKPGAPKGSAVGCCGHMHGLSK